MPSIMFSPDTYNNGFGENESDDSDDSADNYDKIDSKISLPIQ